MTWKPPFECQPELTFNKSRKLTTILNRITTIIEIRVIVSKIMTRGDW